MSSLARRIQLRIMREKKLIPARNKAVNRKKGQPYRNGYFVDQGEGVEPIFVRYH